MVVTSSQTVGKESIKDTCKDSAATREGVLVLGLLAGSRDLKAWGGLLGLVVSFLRDLVFSLLRACLVFSVGSWFLPERSVGARMKLAKKCNSDASS